MAKVMNIFGYPKKMRTYPEQGRPARAWHSGKVYAGTSLPEDVQSDAGLDVWTSRHLSAALDARRIAASDGRR